jgi:MFS family permease
LLTICQDALKFCLSAPLIGPALGPILGGALTQAFNWRATFWFLSILIGIILVVFVFFKDTFRRERSLTYQRVLQRARAQQAAVPNTETSTLTQVTAVNKEISHRKDIEHNEGVSPKGKNDLEAATIDIPNEVSQIKLSLTDINPIPPMWNVLRRLNNLAILSCSGKHCFPAINLSILTLSLLT